MFRKTCVTKAEAASSLLQSHGETGGQSNLFISIRWKILFYFKSFLVLDYYNDRQKQKMPTIDLS